MRAPTLCGGKYFQRQRRNAMEEEQRGAQPLRLYLCTWRVSQLGNYIGCSSSWPWKRRRSNISTLSYLTKELIMRLHIRLGHRIEWCKLFTRGHWYEAIEAGPAVYPYRQVEGLDKKCNSVTTKKLLGPKVAWSKSCFVQKLLRPKAK